MSSRRNAAFVVTMAAALSTLALVACGSTSAPDPKAASSDATKGASSATPASSAASTGAATTSSASPSTSSTPAASASAQTIEDLGKNGLGNIVGANRSKFRGCYDDIKKKKPNLGRGTFSIDFWVNPDGSLKSAKYVKEGSEFEDADLEACIISQLKTLTFPKSALGKEHGTVYQFGFSLNK